MPRGQATAQSMAASSLDTDAGRSAYLLAREWTAWSSTATRPPPPESALVATPVPAHHEGDAITTRAAHEHRPQVGPRRVKPRRPLLHRRERPARTTVAAGGRGR